MAARLDLDLRTVRYGGGAMLALGLILPHLPGNPGVACPLRTLTGVPCPFCGLTTSVKALLGGDLHVALAANPFGILVVAFAAVVLLRPRWRHLSVPMVLVLAGVAVSWAFQLHRFHFL